MTSGLVIRTQELGGRLVMLGTDSARGITVEAPDFSADAWGPSGGSFTLKRNPRVQWPDLRAAAPVLVEDHGAPVWLGRIKNTPMTDGGLARQITVACEGQQFHLDDDSFERTYIHTRLTDYQDIRSSLAADLTKYVTAGNVQAGDSGIVLTYPMGVLLPSPALCGVTLDFGASLCKVVTFNWESSNNSGSFSLLCDGHDNHDGAQSGSVETAITFTAASGASGSTGPLTFATPHRYVSFIFQCSFAGTLGVDVWMRINLAWTFAASAYQSGNTSVLRASDVVADALDRGTLLLSSDRSRIQQTSFYIPELGMSGAGTPRELISVVNNYHEWQFRVPADNVPEYRPLPALTSIEVGADAVFDETSAGDTSEIYTNAIVNYTDAAGQPQSLQRGQTDSLASISDLQPSNPSFTAVGTTGWAAGWGTIARDTGVFDTTPASLKMTTAGSFASIFSSSWVAGSFVPGRPYILTGAIRDDTLFSWWSIFVYDANGQIVGRGDVGTPTINTWFPISIPFSLQTSAPPTIVVTLSGTGSIGWVDSFVLSEVAPTIIDQWGFRRTKVIDTSMALTGAGAQQIADTFLAGKRTTPLKGKLLVIGNGCARRSPSGQGMRCSELLGETGALVRMKHLTDPDTGKLGRIGRIAGASWDPVADAATVDIDSASRSFEALLARMALVVGQVR